MNVPVEKIVNVPVEKEEKQRERERSEPTTKDRLEVRSYEPVSKPTVEVRRPMTEPQPSTSAYVGIGLSLMRYGVIIFLRLISDRIFVNYF